jgi:hypothetical protein
MNVEQRREEVRILVEVIGIQNFLTESEKNAPKQFVHV